MVIFGKSKWNQTKVVVFFKVIELGQGGLYREKRLYSDKSVCNRAKYLYSDKVVVFAQKWLHSCKVVVFGKSGCIRAKVVVLGQNLLYMA